MIKRIAIILIAIIVVAAAGFAVNHFLLGQEEPPPPPPPPAPTEPEPVWTGGGVERINVGLELQEPPLEVLVIRAEYFRLDTDEARVVIDVVVNNLGPTGLGKWWEKDNAFTLYNNSGIVKMASVEVVSSSGPETNLKLTFSNVPTGPLNANQVGLSIRVTGDDQTDMAVGLTPPTSGSLDAEMIIPDPPPEDIKEPEEAEGDEDSPAEDVDDDDNQD